MTIVSFSGIDGAGKSTQIGALESWLRRSGLSTKLVTFWDDVAVLSSSREFASHRVFKGDQGVGSPENPLSRRDKNVTSRWVAAARIFIYFADAINLYLKVRKLRKSNADVVIFDRYIYDELANLPLNHRLARSFMRLVLKFVPKPDVGYVIDAEPTEALARKPEYPLEFVRRNRDSYLRLAKLAGNITVIPSHSIEMVQAEIREELLQKTSRARIEALESSSLALATCLQQVRGATIGAIDSSHQNHQSNRDFTSPSDPSQHLPRRTHRS